MSTASLEVTYLGIDRVLIAPDMNCLCLWKVHI